MTVNALPGLYRTIRFRLTIWNSLVVLTAIFLALFAARQGMKYTLLSESRELLKEEINELELAVQAFYPDQERLIEEFQRKILGHSRHQWFAWIKDSQGNTIWKSENANKLMKLPPAEEPSSGSFLSARPGRTEFAVSPASLIAWRTVSFGSTESWTIVLGEPTDFIRKSVQNLTYMIVLIGSGFLILAPIGGYFLAQRSMQPVQRIVQSTRNFDPAKLKTEDRLPIRGTKDELDQISMEINKFLDQLSHYLSSQREFIANASHELRSPLTAIQTSVEVCLDKTRSEEEYRDLLETVSEQCEFLRRLVNQLLDLAETETTTTLSSTEFDLGELVDRCVSVFSGVADEKRLSVEFRNESDQTITGDRQKLMLVVNNLIDNAIKYSRPGGTIHIKLEDVDDRVRFTVLDNGPGVPNQMLERIFDRFFQVDQSRKRDSARGNGLGLSICKSVIELHRGRIRAKNAGGLKVTFELPATG